MRILFASASFAMHYGGPAYSVSRLACTIANFGAQVGLWAPDGTAEYLALPQASRNVRLLTGSLTEALRSFGPVDLLHDSGIWLPHNHAIARFATEEAIPLVVSTRGMLEPWAIRHKQGKKWIAWHLYQKRNLRRAQLLHATSEREGENLEGLQLGVPIRVLPNGIDVPEAVSARTKPQTKYKALFVGRIAPVKGLGMLIDAWASVRPEDWTLLIAGPDEVGYLGQLRQAVQRHRLTEGIVFPGPVKGEAKARLFQEADFFVLPSLSESFGMAVAEALSYGLPVLTTSSTPWGIIAKLGCGWVVEPKVLALAEALREATSADIQTLRDMGAIGKQIAIQRFGWDNIGHEFIAIYRNLVGMESDSHTPPGELQTSWSGQ
jgi:glycosyltransferase involved in cell wall biosynthesis